MVVHHPPQQLRRTSDRPAASTDVLAATSPSSPSGSADAPLGVPTTSARTPRGTWALYFNGSEVLVVHPGGTLAGLPADVAAELDRLTAQPGYGELDLRAALPDPRPDRPISHRNGRCLPWA